MDYEAQLLNPKWQRRRLTILNRDNFTCTNCGNTEQTLHVHHLEYLGDLAPWEYHDDMLYTLCSYCHKLEKGREKIEIGLLRTFKMKGFLCGDLSALSSAIDTNDDFKNYLHSYLRKFKNG